MEFRRVSLVALAATSACRPVAVPARIGSPTADVPAGWAVVAPYDSGSVSARCATRAREQWRVALTGRGTIQILPDTEWTTRREIAVPDGRLVGINRGEFGGGVWWIPAGAGDSVLLTPENLRAFVRRPSGEILGLVGLAHMGIDTGTVLTFRREEATWRALPLVNLRGAPVAYTALRGDSVLILTTETLQLLRGSSELSVWHRNPMWLYLYAGSLVRDASGALYIGMRHAVARLTPSDTGLREEWLIPAACRTMRPTGDYGCTCEGPPA